MYRLKIKRIYETVAVDDGIRVLVDRLWPRGIGRERAAIDYWMKDIAPSDSLREWYGHEIARWDGFRTRYFDELSLLTEQTARLRALLKKGNVTLLYSARADKHNNAIALAEYISHAQSDSE